MKLGKYLLLLYINSTDIYEVPLMLSRPFLGTGCAMVKALPSWRIQPGGDEDISPEIVR
jgi:hypothetical protein